VNSDRRLILASASPRRLALLAEAGWNVTVVSPDTDEAWPENESVESGVCQLALRKARRVSRARTDSPVLAADTVVTLNGQVFGKPASRRHAYELLRQLSGRTHEVVTGVALVLGEESWTAWERSRVTFRSLSDAEIERYLEDSEYQDKAGAYGIQDDEGRLVRHWEGSFDNIVGLPMSTVESLWGRMQEGRDRVR
jgi:septum formation protein